MLLMVPVRYLEDVGTQPRCARRCSVCHGHGGRYRVDLPAGAIVTEIVALSREHLLLHLLDGEVMVARYFDCPACDKLGMRPGQGERLRDVEAWARRVRFTWPSLCMRATPRRAMASGCIDVAAQRDDAVAISEVTLRPVAG